MASLIKGQLVVVDSVPDTFALLVRKILEPISKVREVVLALSGGPTARLCYDQLASLELSDRKVNWGNIHIIMGDERCVDLTDNDSNAKLVKESLLDKVGPVKEFTPLTCSDQGTSVAKVIEDAARENSTLGIDLAHLGLGPDGHSASLFPNSLALLANDSLLTTLNSDPSGNNPHERVTLTYGGLSRAEKTLITVSGPSKADALAQIASGIPLPAANLHSHGLIWIVDQTAASKLPSSIATSVDDLEI
ncbi:MAG: 6-phosphogluconolactonase [Acidimicrobiales bacterium]|nr:6-phosphogluconolactonase [Acidimicrobiales bacterium]